MKPKLFLHHASLLLLIGGLLAACTPPAQPVATATAPAGESTPPPATLPMATATAPSTEMPQDTEAPPAATAVSGVAGCPFSGELVYLNSLYNYCFTYPEGYTLREEQPQGPFLSGPALDDNPNPLRVNLNVSARPVPEGADLGGLVTGFLSQNFPDMPQPIERTPTTLGGEPAELLEDVPGLLGSRVVLAVHGTILYQLSFNPSDIEEANAGLKGLYETVLASFTYLPDGERLVFAPETASYFEFGRIFSFTYDPALTLLVEALTVDAVPPNPETMIYDTHPAFAQFRFLGYNGGRPAEPPFDFLAPRLMVFPTQEFAEFGPNESGGFAQQLADLRSLLETQPDLKERCSVTQLAGEGTGLPFLPWQNMAQVFCAQPQYIKFNDGKGIRYLTAYSQGITPILDPLVFYTFQGISDDGQYYISAVFPVMTGLFPLEVHPGVEGEQPQTLSEEQLNALNTQAGDLFQPALGQLDGLVSSLRVDR